MPILCGKRFAENKGKIAAVIVEPVPANAGLYFPSDDFLSILRKECTSNGALLIFDEVLPVSVWRAAARRRFTESNPI